jgi:DNA-binding transcriptional MerR regulator
MSQSGPTFAISDLAREFDITPRTIRFWEDQGILAPQREGNKRIFTRRDRARLKMALRGKRLGLSLAEIRPHRHVCLDRGRDAPIARMPAHHGKTAGWAAAAT